MKKRDILMEIKEILISNFELTRDIVQQINSWNGALDFLEWFENDDEFFEVYFQGRIIEALQKACYGDYNYNDDYVKFNNLENFESGNELDVIKDYENYIDEIIEAMIELWHDARIEVEPMLGDLVDEYETLEGDA